MPRGKRNVTDAERAFILEKHQEGWTYQQIAEALGFKSKGTVNAPGCNCDCRSVSWGFGAFEGIIRFQLSIDGHQEPQLEL